METCLKIVVKANEKNRSAVPQLGTEYMRPLRRFYTFQ
jgi:hypothetical protein